MKMHYVKPLGYISPVEASAILLLNSGRSVNWIYLLQDNRLGRRFMQVGKIPYLKVDRNVYYQEADIYKLSAYLKDCSAKNKLVKQFFP